MSIKLLIADDHQLFRESLSGLFDPAVIEIVGQASSGQEAIELSRKLKPDVVLMDITMNGLNGIEATRVIKSELPMIKIIGLSIHNDKSFIKGMFEAGAIGYMLKNCSFAKLMESIFAAFNSTRYLSEEIADIVICDYISPDAKEFTKESLLTSREKDVLKMYANGLTTRKIAELLFISSKTVDSHKQNIYKKLEIKTPAEMVRYALKLKLISI